MTATIPVGSAPVNIAVNPKAKTIYVTNESGNNVSVLPPAPISRAFRGGRGR